MAGAAPAPLAKAAGEAARSLARLGARRQRLTH